MFTRSIIGTALLALVGVVAFRALVDHHAAALASRHSFDVPAGGGGYTRLTSAEAKAEGDAVASDLQAFSAEVFSKPKVGVFGKGSATTRVILIAVNVIDSPELTREVGAHSLDSDIGPVLSGAGVPTAAPFPPGRFGGALRCGTRLTGNGSIAVCIWLDNSTLGAVMSPNGTVADTAAVTLALREAGEH